MSWRPPSQQGKRTVCSSSLVSEKDRVAFNQAVDALRAKDLAVLRGAPLSKRVGRLQTVLGGAMLNLFAPFDG